MTNTHMCARQGLLDQTAMQVWSQRPALKVVRPGVEFGVKSVVKLGIKIGGEIEGEIGGELGTELGVELGIGLGMKSDGRALRQ